MWTHPQASWPVGDHGAIVRFKRLCRLTKGRQVCGAGLAAPKDGVNSGGWACVTNALQATAVVLYIRRTDVGHAREGSPHTRSLVFRLFVPLRTLASPTALIPQSDNTGYLVFLVYIFTQYVDVTWHTTQLRVTQLSVGAAGKEFEKCYGHSGSDHYLLAWECHNVSLRRLFCWHS